MAMWYDLTPANYAKGLRFNADRCDQQAEHHRNDSRAWSPYEEERAVRNARRLRAMAILCDVATVDRAGEVDFLGMQCPAQTREEEDAAVACAEALLVAPNTYRRGRSEYEGIRALASDPRQQPAIVTQEEHDDMLGCVPPIYVKNLAGFLVGEAITGDERGLVYAHYWRAPNGEYRARYYCLADT